MFDFLKEERSEIKTANLSREVAMNKINEEFTVLDNLWKEAEKVNFKSK